MGIGRNNNDDRIDLPRSRMVEWNLVDGKNDNEKTINNQFPSDKLYPSIQRLISSHDVRHILVFIALYALVKYYNKTNFVRMITFILIFSLMNG